MISRLLLIAAVMTLASTVTQAQKRVREAPFSADYISPPRSLAEMSAQADAVVVAKFTGEARSIELPHPATLFTDSVFTVQEIVKLHTQVPTVGSTMLVRTLGGDRDRGTHTERRVDELARPLVKQRSYVLFLKWVPQQDFHPAWGPAGFFDITDSRVHSISKESTGHDGLSLTEFLTETRKAPATGK